MLKTLEKIIVRVLTIIFLCTKMYYGDEVGEEVNDVDSGIFYELKSLEQDIFRTFFNLDEVDKKKMPAPTQMRIIGYMLNHQDEDIFQRDLEEVLKLSRATVSEVLQTMERNGLISREIYEEDSRVKKVVLNQMTKDIFEKKKMYFQSIEKALTKDIKVEDLDVFKKVIRQMHENIEYIKEERKRI